MQTRWPGAGGSPVGQLLLRRAVAEGNLLGIHSGSVRGHVPHPAMPPAELRASLRAGAADIEAAGGGAPALVRPPGWKFDPGTLSTYRSAALEMVLTDVSARDGSLVLFQVDPEGGGRFHWELGCLKERVEQGNITPLDGVVPVVVTFHDTNGYTARHLEQYLSTLVRAARTAGLEVAQPPFYASAQEAGRAARMRAPSTHGWRNRVIPGCPD